MKSLQWLAAVLVMLLITVAETMAGEPAPYAAHSEGFLQRVGPAGGWCPYGGGLLHWWKPYCFPHVGASDDYCRKSLPKVCWPTYPPFYTWGPPDIGLPHHPFECVSKK